MLDQYAGESGVMSDHVNMYVCACMFVCVCVCVSNRTMHTSFQLPVKETIFLQYMPIVILLDEYCIVAVIVTVATLTSYLHLVHTNCIFTHSK